MRLLVSVSVVARPTSVSLAAGKLSVPEAAACGCTTVPPDVLPLRVMPPADTVGLARVALVRAALTIFGELARTTAPLPVTPLERLDAARAVPLTWNPLTAFTVVDFNVPLTSP